MSLFSKVKLFTDTVKVVFASGSDDAGGDQMSYMDFILATVGKLDPHDKLLEKNPYYAGYLVANDSKVVNAIINYIVNDKKVIDFIKSVDIKNTTDKVAIRQYNQMLLTILQEIEKKLGIKLETSTVRFIIQKLRNVFESYDDVNNLDVEKIKSNIEGLFTKTVREDLLAFLEFCSTFVDIFSKQDPKSGKRQAELLYDWLYATGKLAEFKNKDLKKWYSDFRPVVAEFDSLKKLDASNIDQNIKEDFIKKVNTLVSSYADDIDIILK